MKFLVLLAVAVACAAADEAYVNIPIVRSSQEASPEGYQFSHGFESANGIVQQAEGVVKNPNSEEPTLEIRGTYTYTGDDGAKYETTYIANEGGYQPSGAHLPVPPPIPELIARALAYTAARSPPVEKVYKP